MNTPLVSIIIPNYNHAQYLEKRIDTVLNQTYQNIEVIILDDQSTDNSLEVIKKYRNHPKIAQIVVNERNTGNPFKQWDKGIRLANGELIWIAESDDYNELTFLQEIIREWNKHKDVVVAFSSYVMVWGDDNSFNKERKTQCFNGINFIKNRMSRGNQIMNASGVVFKKKTYFEIDYEFMIYHSSGDYLMWVKMLEQGKVLKINKNLTYFRQVMSSVTSLSKKQGITAYEDKSILDYIDKTFSLNGWQKRMAFAARLKYFSEIKYESKLIRDDIFTLWEMEYHQWNPSPFVIWVIGLLERHLNILI